MSKRKGISAEEKRARMLQLFHEKKDFFQLKELEKLAPKEKGIVVQSVKDIVQNLTDDNLVNSDKIGTSVYYWAFPCDKKRMKKNKLADTKQNISATRLKLENTLRSIDQHQTGKENNSQRQQILEENETLKKKHDELEADIKKFDGNDPELYKRKSDEIDIAIEAANRWTDNIFSLKSWCKKKFSIEEDVLSKRCGIPNDIDYI